VQSATISWISSNQSENSSVGNRLDLSMESDGQAEIVATPVYDPERVRSRS